MSSIPSTIRVTVPPAVLYDYERLQKVQKELLVLVGCAGCHSGWQFDYHLAEQTFTFDESLSVSKQ